VWKSLPSRVTKNVLLDNEELSKLAQLCLNGHEDIHNPGEI
jgi:hypothetical protein